MKLSTVIALILAAQSAAFAPHNARVAQRTRSTQSFSSMDRNSVLDGSYPGDRGFDPLGFSNSKPALYQYRQAEIKHARLAMLAAVGWPVSEVLNPKIADYFHLSPTIDETGCAPSILNGTLNKINPLFWIVCVLAASWIESYGLSRIKTVDALPGDLGFDPLGLYPRDEAGQRYMQLAEIQNGRLAMVAIIAFVFQEYITDQGVVRATPIFFQPAVTAIRELAN
ncbi:light-harvesting complex II chlorophyll a/b binding protein 2 [Fistulifera solaris]|uniref:Light-harvesting complex II chlorophyll a/b binding protein 2 n=1 Tax=Fistulifera solaris TaxID=1519565 RepID=A0A1Z5JEP8_FISSO|nr:light-harvesting complex II chlorophyll a/b binding protein 2 [Fistulifera solaris]|eukprot:GAX12480.1 light-harvesting complex II chlorophyll a/b binding protein 2 [Fistulifera solaris]